MRKLFSSKKALLGMGITAVMFGICNIGVAHADTSMKVFIDNQPLVSDVPPMIIKDRTMLPLHAVFDSLGAQVQWVPQSEEVIGSRGANSIDLHVNDTQAYVNGQAVTLDVAPMIVNSRTMVPLHFIAQSLGATVTWDQSTETVEIHQQSYTLTTQVQGQGTVSTHNNATSYLAGSIVPITATPASGWQFDHWVGDVADSTAASTSVVTDANKTVQAVFKQQTQPSYPVPTVGGQTVSLTSMSDLVTYVNQFSGIGIPYLYGGTDLTPFGSGIDCSSFVQQMYAHFGISLPRTSEDQYTVGTAVQRSDLQLGDLVFFHTDGAGPTHVGIYTGNDQFVSATVSGGVKAQSLDIDYWNQNYEGARRVFVLPTSGAGASGTGSTSTN